jgi:hypothetical protein
LSAIGRTITELAPCQPQQSLCRNGGILGNNNQILLQHGQRFPAGRGFQVIEELEPASHSRALSFALLAPQKPLAGIFMRSCKALSRPTTRRSNSGIAEATARRKTEPH